MIYLLNISIFSLLPGADPKLGQQKTDTGEEYQKNRRPMLKRNGVYFVEMKRDDEQHQTGEAPEKKKNRLTDDSGENSFQPQLSG